MADAAHAGHSFDPKRCQNTPCLLPLALGCRLSTRRARRSQPWLSGITSLVRTALDLGYVRAWANCRVAQGLPRGRASIFRISGFVHVARHVAANLERPPRGWFIVRRYCRLGLPYLGAIALAVAACASARGWLSESVIGPPPTIARVLAHVVFLQDILGYDSLSAGLWFVCIDFQLGLIYVGRCTCETRWRE